MTHSGRRMQKTRRALRFLKAEVGCSCNTPGSCVQYFRFVHDVGQPPLNKFHQRELLKRDGRPPDPRPVHLRRREHFS
eukprot:6033520-Pyramimonas_sp.AAC.1